MHNFWVRVNSVVFFALTVLFAMASMAAISTYLHKGTPDVRSLRLNTLLSLRNHAGADRAVLNFDLDADMRPAFHWNLKQLFVFVVAEYESKKIPLNQVVIWDTIIESKDQAHVHFKNLSTKYALVDNGSDLRNRTIHLKLKWDHMPYTGRMYYGEAGGSSFTLPHKYVVH